MTLTASVRAHTVSAGASVVCWSLGTATATLAQVNEVGQRVGPGAHVMLLCVLVAVAGAWLAGAPVAGAATGSLASIERGSSFGWSRWSAEQIQASGTTPVLVGDPEPLADPQTNEPLVLAGGITPPSTPAPLVIVTTPVPRTPGTIHARFVIRWGWDGRRIVLRSIRARGLPRRAHVALGCTGPACPHIMGRAAGRGYIVALLRRLVGRRFAPGDVMSITVRAPGLRREPIQLRIRRQRVPLARLLKG